MPRWHPVAVRPDCFGKFGLGLELHEIAKSFDARRLAVASRIEWPTLILIGACHAAWIAAGLVYATEPLLSAGLLPLMITLHSSLQHETIHHHPTRWTGLNEALVALPIGLLMPYRRFREQHLAHHVDSRLTDPYDDPESFYMSRGDWQRLPRALQMLLAWNNMLAIRMLIGPAITAAIFLSTEAKVLIRPTERQGAWHFCLAWLLHLTGLAGVLLIVRFVFVMPIGIYLVAAYLASSLLALRSFCEHRWAEHPGARTIIVERSLLGPLFMNNNLHLVHHAHPALPWYALPGAYRAKREEWLSINDNYVFHGYRAILREFGFRVKEAVSHPVRARR